MRINQIGPSRFILVVWFPFRLWLRVALAALVVVFCSNWDPVRSQVINYKTVGQNFSPYIDGQDPNLRSPITEQQLRTRMQIVAPYSQWIRTFGTTDGLEKAGLVARSLGLKAAIGAWLGRDLAANELQVTNLINICQAGQCDMAIVGSEVLLRGDLSEAQLIDYVKRVRLAIPAAIPVTTADVYGQLLTHPNVIANVDLVMANFYPYWEGIRVDLAMGALHAQYRDLKTAAGAKQVLVSETGWPSAGDQIGSAVPSAQNASFYFLNFVSWARANDVQYFYFESFDESWKAKYEGPQGAHWGIWDKDGNLKPGMQEVFDGKTIPDNWSSGVISCEPNSPKLRFTSVPALGSFDNLMGQVCGVMPADFRIVIYIKVGSGWWIKPFANQPLTTILNDGSWSADITTGGIDQTATEIVAYLVPNGFSPPILLGSPTIPDTLAQNSIAKAEALRCSYSITPASHPFSQTGGTGSVSVTTSDNRCTWTSVSNASWIDITSSTGNGNGTVTFSVAPNNDTGPRTGTLTIAGKTFTVTQTGTGILCGQTLTSDIPAGQSHSYTFTGNAGERVRVGVDELGASFAGLTVSLKNSAGTLVAEASGKPAVIDSVALPATGSYTIVVSAVVSPTIYNVSLVFTTGRCGTAISCGQTQSNNQIQRAQLDAYTFAGNADERVRVAVDELGASFAGLTVSLYTPSGTLVTQASGKPAVIDNVALPTTGHYSIVVSAVVSSTTYNVSVVFTTGHCGTAITCGQTQSNKLIQRAQLDAYMFNGNAGERVRIAVDELGASFAGLNVSLYTPSGTLVAHASGKPAVIDVVDLPATGTYTIIVSVVVSSTTYNVSLVFTSGRCGTAITCGQTQSNKQIQRAQLDAYTFAGTAGERVRVVVNELSPSFAGLNVSLYTPSGTLVTQASGKPAEITNVVLTATGTYTIVISTVVSATTYKVELYCTDASRIPILISEETSTRSIALDSVTQLRDPFPTTSPVSWGPDTRTRVMIFAFNLELLPGENLSIITADAEDASHRVYPLTVEHVGKVPGFDWLNCLIVRLHNGMGDIGDVLVRVTARGFPSNRVRIGIGHRGGGLPDDPGAVPTPGRKP